MRLLPCVLTALAALWPVLPAAAQSPDSSRSNNPQLELWLKIKRLLLSPDDKDAFEHYVKDTLLPDGPNGVKSFIGTVLSSQPAEGPSELVLALSAPQTSEVTLRLIRSEDGKAAYLKKPVAPGTKVAFRGVARWFTQEPFMLTFEIGFPRGLGSLSILDEPPAASQRK